MKEKRQKRIRIRILFCVLGSIVCFSLCMVWMNSKMEEKETKIDTEKIKVEEENTVQGQGEKEYDLFVEDAKKEEVEEECIQWMNRLEDLYGQEIWKDTADGQVSGKMLKKMQEILSESGYPIITSQPYSIMKNYKKMETFLKNCLEGIPDSIVLFHLSGNGGVTRKEYNFDGTSMYLLTARAGWNDSGDPVVSSISYAKIKKWVYTEKGWFSYELSVPEPPEVSEVVDGTEMIRVIPLAKKYRKLSKKYVLPLGYRGNNLLCSSWDQNTRNAIDYNGLFEYLYPMKYDRPFDSGKYVQGIPAEEFEAVIMEYLPVTAEELREWAAFDDTTQTYLWSGIGNGNSNASYLGTAIPEVVDRKEKENGIMVLTVDAVCEGKITDGTAITHKLTIRVAEDGSFQYLGNQIIQENIEEIFPYTYRIFQNKEQ